MDTNTTTATLIATAARNIVVGDACYLSGIWGDSIVTAVSTDGRTVAITWTTPDGRTITRDDLSPIQRIGIRPRA